MKRTVQLIVVAGFFAAFSTVAVSMDGSKPVSQAATAVDNLGKARQLIAARQWQAAIAELQQLNATRDANWNNLMGYSYRKADPPDLVTAEKYYGAALAIDPKHLGTLEYLGELRLQQGDLTGAEKQLATLKKASFFKSEEFKDLQGAIARYKAAGNKYVAAD